MTAFISIIIPAKNESKWLPFCLNSLSYLDYPLESYELILVDNGSIDNTVQIASDFGMKVFSKPNLTVSGLRNFGASIAKGSVLAFLDADIGVSENWLSSANASLNRHSTVCCIGGLINIPDNYSWLAQTMQYFYNTSKISPGGYANWIPSANIVIKKEAFNKIGGFKSELKTCEDVDFCFRLSKICKIMVCKDIKVIHYGEIQTVKEFFQKERWRGVGNFDGIIYHGLRLDEIPSLVLPVYYVFLMAWLSFAVIFCDIISFLINIILWLIPPLLKSFQKVKRSDEKFKFFVFLKVSISYFVYCIARTVAAMDWLIIKLKHVKNCLE